MLTGLMDVTVPVPDPGVAGFVQAHWPMMIVSLVIALIIIKFSRALWSSGATRGLIIVVVALAAGYWFLQITGKIG